MAEVQPGSDSLCCCVLSQTYYITISLNWTYNSIASLNLVYHNTATPNPACHSRITQTCLVQSLSPQSHPSAMPCWHTDLDSPCSSRSGVRWGWCILGWWVFRGCHVGFCSSSCSYRWWFWCVWVCGGVRGLCYVLTCHGWPVEQLDALMRNIKVHNSFDVLGNTWHYAVPWLKWSVAGLSPWSTWSDPRPVDAGFVVYILALGYVFLQILWFCPISFILSILDMHSSILTNDI
jgi:hypothetical protein